MGRALLEGKVVHIADVMADPDYTFVEGQRGVGFRTVLSVPMLREGTPIGVLGLSRREVRPFTDKQIELVLTFDSQSKTVRLFESVEARTRELAASLENLCTTRTASSNILCLDQAVLRGAQILQRCGKLTCASLDTFEKGARFRLQLRLGRQRSIPTRSACR